MEIKLIKERNFKIYLYLIQMLFSLSCVSTKDLENCKIEKVLDIVVKNDDFYTLQVRFKRCTSKEIREILVKNELVDKFPAIKNKPIVMEEYLGKMHNVYRYEIRLK